MSLIGLTTQQATLSSQNISGVTGTSLTIPGGYTAPYIMVSKNGARLQPGVDYTATDGATVTLATAAIATDVFTVDVFGIFGVALNPTITSANFTATAAQTTFNVSYIPPYVMVMRNGSMLGPTDYTATNGTSVILGTACSVGDQVAIWTFGAFNVSYAQGAAANGCIYENYKTITASHTINSDKGGHSVGPITINPSVTVTVSSGAKWVVQ